MGFIMSDKDNLLSSEELDALSADSKVAPNLGSKAQKYDIASETASLTFNLGALDRINVSISRALASDLEGEFKDKVKIVPETAEIVSFGDYCKQADEITATNIVAIGPLRGRGLVIFENAMLLSALDNYFGGPGVQTAKSNDSGKLTPTERAINSLLLNSVLGSIRSAWKPVISISPAVLGFETQVEAAKITSSLSSVFVNKFQVFFGKTKMGWVEIIYPYSMLRVVRDDLIHWAQGSSKQESPESTWQKDLESAVTSAQVEMRIEIGTINLTLKEFEMLHEEEVVIFSKPDLAKATVNEIPIFEGNIGSQLSQMAIQIVKPFKATK